MGDKGRPRSKTGRSPSSNNLRRSASKTESNSDPIERVETPVENTIPWDVFTSEQIQSLLSLTPLDALTKLCELIPAADTHINLRNSITADTYLFLLHFANQNKLNDTKTGALITLFKHILTMIKDGKSLIDIVMESSQLLTCQKDFHPKMKFDFFSKDEVLAVTEYLKSTVFQQFKLYRFTLLQEQEETIISLEKIVNTCPPMGSFDPPPLAEAISEHDIEVYLNAPPPESEKEEEEGEGEEGAGDEGAVDDSREGVAPLAPVISMKNVQSVLDTVGGEMLDKLAKDMSNKCAEKESQYLNRLNKVKKSLD